MTTNGNQQEALISIKSNPINDARLKNLEKARQALALKKQQLQASSASQQTTSQRSTVSPVVTGAQTARNNQQDFELIELVEEYNNGMAGTGYVQKIPSKTASQSWFSGSDITENGNDGETLLSRICWSIVRVASLSVLYLGVQLAVRASVGDGDNNENNYGKSINQSISKGQQRKSDEFVPGQSIFY